MQQKLTSRYVDAPGRCLHETRGHLVVTADPADPDANDAVVVLLGVAGVQVVHLMRERRLI